MEYLRNAWETVTNTVTDLWYYFFGRRGSQQLLLEYVIMDENLNSKYVYTGDDKITKKSDKSKELYNKLVDTNKKEMTLSNGTKYQFLFEKYDYEDE
jgi:hypothetical protein